MNAYKSISMGDMALTAKGQDGSRTAEAIQTRRPRLLLVEVQGEKDERVVSQDTLRFLLCEGIDGEETIQSSYPRFATPSILTVQATKVVAR